VWDDVVYHKAIPSLDCKEHTYPIGHVQKGLSVSYTVWVSIIPITFTAGGTLELELDWGWKICDSDLSALLELIPGATLNVYGDAEINLLIIKAGLQLAGSFNTQLRPQGYIAGTNCSIGIDMRQVTKPMNIGLESYYAWRHCTLWIFDCKWGQHHQHTWYQWSHAPVDKVLYDKHWTIKP